MNAIQLADTRLGADVRKALEMLGEGVDVVGVTDIQEIMACGIMAMPALVTGGKIVVVGRMLLLEEAQKAIADA